MAGATTFQFRAMDLAGATSAGEIEAESKAAVGEQLRQRGLIVLDVSEKSNPLKLEDYFKRWKGVDKRELSQRRVRRRVGFTKQARQQLYGVRIVAGRDGCAHFHQPGISSSQ